MASGRRRHALVDHLEPEVIEPSRAGTHLEDAEEEPGRLAGHVEHNGVLCPLGGAGHRPVVHVVEAEHARETVDAKPHLGRAGHS